MQEQAQQPAFRPGNWVAAQRRQDRHAELEHRFGDDFAGLDQAHAARPLGNQQIAGRKNRQAPGNLEAVGYHFDVQLHLARSARVALYQLARCRR